MSTVRKTITLTEQQEEWVKAQIAVGRYTNDSEYIRDLVRRDQEDRAKLEALRQAIREGRESGIYEGDAFAAVREKLTRAARNE